VRPEAARTGGCQPAPDDIGWPPEAAPWQELPAAFFARPSSEVAPELIGKVLWREGVGGGRLTEVEAYLPVGDPACHAAGGRTARNASMFGPPGHVYVYLSYGIHVLLNLVCEEEGVGSAVLVRSFAPVGDVSALLCNRGLEAGSDRAAARPAAPGAIKGKAAQTETGGEAQAALLPASLLAKLSSGPGRAGQALGLTLGLDGLPLGPASGLYVLDDGLRLPVRTSTRIGISKGKDLPLRFLAGS